MTPQTWQLPLIKKTALFFALKTMVAISPVMANEKLDVKYSKSIKAFEFSKSLKVRGFEVSDGVYMGQAKVGGKYGFGVVVDRKNFSWGVNNRGLSISKRF